VYGATQDSCEEGYDLRLRGHTTGPHNLHSFRRTADNGCLEDARAELVALSLPPSLPPSLSLSLALSLSRALSLSLSEG